MKFGYKVEINQYCLNCYYSDEEYGDWRSDYSNDFEKISKTKKYPDLVTDIDYQVGQKCYLVWIEWSSGNSFGNSYRCNTEAIGLFKCKSDAQQLATKIEEFDKNDDTKLWDDRYKFNCKTSDGQEFVYGFAPWSGYFDTLEEVHLEEVIIEK